MASTVAEHLIGTWMHSHEEDTDAVSVYRPSTFTFPPARGRRGYEFRPDHTCTYIGISARDGSAKSSCRWELRGDEHPETVVSFPDGHQEILPIVSASQDKLVIQKSSL
jgi:hypothetical protein